MSVSLLNILEIMRDIIGGTVRIYETITKFEEESGKPFDKALEDMTKDKEFWTRVPAEVIGEFFTIYAKYYSLSLKLENFTSLSVEEKRKIVKSLRSLEHELEEFTAKVKNMVVQQ
ncbi:MAG: hypothetical protein P3X22_001650 [Thermoprotei archaeon]|nr:hypothetical protein [Thermoprotei archaeon]